MRLLIFLFITFLNIHCFSQTINGKVLDTDTQKPLAGTIVYLVNPKPVEDTINVTYWQASNYKIIATTKTNHLGKYSFTLLQPKVYSLIVSYQMPTVEKFGGVYSFRNDIDSNIIVRSKTNYNKIFHLMVTCPYDKTKNQAFCPQCKRSDKVIPILAGLPIFDSSGNINGQSIENYHLASCIIDLYCNPTKHCKRCNKDF
jgi:hypothetical protein